MIVGGKTWPECFGQSTVVKIWYLVVFGVFAMDKTLDGIAIVVEDKTVKH